MSEILRRPDEPPAATSEGDRMPIDPYSSCPGGTGKKIKFCCADLVGDLEQLEKLTEGEQ